jgi:hypothetical protein
MSHAVVSPGQRVIGHRSLCHRAGFVSQRWWNRWPGAKPVAPGWPVSEWRPELRNSRPGALADAPGVPGTGVSCPGAKLDAPMPRAKAAELATTKSAISAGIVRNLIMFGLLLVVFRLNSPPRSWVSH